MYNLQYSSFVFHNQKRIEKPIDIYMPNTPNEIYRDIITEKNALAKYNIINEKTNLNIGNMKISFCKNEHPVETYAIKLTNGKETIVYTADTSFSSKDKLVEFARNADLLICESSLLKSYGYPEINGHLTANQAGIIAKEANVRGLILTHLWPEEQPEKYEEEAKQVFKKVIVAKEGKIINLSKEKEKETGMR